jgi:hypothetical protein
VKSQLSMSCGDHSGSKTQATQEIPRSSTKSMMASPYVSSAMTGMWAPRASADEYAVW